MSSTRPTVVVLEVLLLLLPGLLRDHHVVLLLLLLLLLNGRLCRLQLSLRLRLRLSLCGSLLLLLGLNRRGRLGRTRGDSRWKGERSCRRRDRRGDHGRWDGLGCEVLMSKGLVRVESPSRLELQQVLQEVDRCECQIRRCVVLGTYHLGVHGGQWRGTAAWGALPMDS